MAESIDEYFTATVSALESPAVLPRRSDSGALTGGSALTVRNALSLFGAQLASRHLDLAARRLRSQGKGFYTIGSSGHEGNAAVAAASG